jgi:hypothetical protein
MAATHSAWSALRLEIDPKGHPDISASLSKPLDFPAQNRCCKYLDLHTTATVRSGSKPVQLIEF